MRFTSLKQTVVISRYEAREITAGKWEWKKVKKVVSIPMAVIDFAFGWVLGGNPEPPVGDPSDSNARVRSRGRR